LQEILSSIPTWSHLAVIPGLLVGFTVHELGHALAAYWLGDSGQVRQGKLTFNPLRHVFWLGFLTFVFLGIGWARPIRVDARHFKSPFAGVLLVAVAGALANILWAVLVAVATLGLVIVVAAFTPVGAFALLGDLTANVDSQPAIVAWGAAFTTQMVYVNLALAFFNLLPLPGLDGFAVLISIIGWIGARSEGEGEAALEEDLTGTAVDEEVNIVPRPLRSGDDRTPADIHFERGVDYFAAGQYDDAIARYRQAISQDERYGPAYVGMGQAYLALGQMSRAEHAFNGAVQYASDERSRRVAWAGLRQVRADEAEVKERETEEESASVASSAEVSGSAKDTVRFNWVQFRVASLVFFAANWGVYLVLAIGLISHFS
jgi:Zn-dependent protease